MKSTNTSRFMARARSVRKKQAPFRMQIMCRLPFGIVAGDLFAEFPDAGLDLLGGDQNPQVRIGHGNFYYPPSLRRVLIGPEVNVRAGGLAGHGLAEGEVGNVVRGQVFAQPDAFGLIGVDGHIHAPAVVEAQRAVHRRFAHGAHRQRLAELPLEGRFHAAESWRSEDAVAIEALGQARALRRAARPAVRLQRLPRRAPSRPVRESSWRAIRPGRIPCARNPDRRRKVPSESCGAAPASTSFLASSNACLAPLEAPAGGGHHFVRLFVGEILAVECRAEQRLVFGIGERGFRLFQLQPAAACPLPPGTAQVSIPAWRAPPPGVLRGLRKNADRAQQEESGRRTNAFLL